MDIIESYSVVIAWNFMLIVYTFTDVDIRDEARCDIGFTGPRFSSRSSDPLLPIDIFNIVLTHTP
jgi:hypothetical protein